jgi:hypothetical protein
MNIATFQFNPHEEYPDHETREEVKRLGWEIIHDEKTNIYQKARAYVFYIIWSHYWRARIDIEDSKNSKSILRKIRGNKYHPGYVLDIDHYTPHWLHANSNGISYEVLKEIQKQFSYLPEENKYLPYAMSQYQGY